MSTANTTLSWSAPLTEAESESIALEFYKKQAQFYQRCAAIAAMIQRMEEGY